MAEVRVPDIGDFKDVPVIEVLVKAGDTVKAEDALVTLESDKATMDVPAPLGGVVAELKVKVGDKVSEGALVLTLVDRQRGGGSAAAPAAAAARRAARRRPQLRRKRAAASGAGRQRRRSGVRARLRRARACASSRASSAWTSAR